MAKIFSHHVYLLALLISVSIMAMEIETTDQDYTTLFLWDVTSTPCGKIVYKDLREWSNKHKQQNEQFNESTWKQQFGPSDTIKLIYLISSLKKKFKATENEHFIRETLPSSELPSNDIILYPGTLWVVNNTKEMLCIDLSSTEPIMLTSDDCNSIAGLQVLTGQEAAQYLSDTARHEHSKCPSNSSLPTQDELAIQVAECVLNQQETSFLQGIVQQSTSKS